MIERNERPPLSPQGFQQKFSFHSKEIVAISCSWCKQAVSAEHLLTSGWDVIVSRYNTV